ncbi:MAG TPA: TonB-dependent receptor [Burkholderiales bacterium]|nr:TonB-dependent receptor [Burkholderiales bacterium]
MMPVVSSGQIVSSTAPEVVVTATRFDESPQTQPVGVAVITADDIRNSTAATVPELLEHIAGIQVRDSSGSPNWQVDMRGFGVFGDQNTLVLLDGQRISENEQASVNWESIPLSSIERIEIMRGGGAVLYGGGATGGTINIITRTPQRDRLGGYAGIEAGSYDTQNYTAGINLAGSETGLVVNARHLETDNYRDGNQLRDQNAQADLQWQDGRNRLYAKFGGDAQDLQLPGALTEAQIEADRRQVATPGDFSRMSDGHVNLGGEFGLGDAQFALNLQYRGKTVHSAFFVATPFRDDVDTQVDVWSATPRLRVPFTLGGVASTLITGIDWDQWKYDSTTAFGAFVAGHPLSDQRNRAWYVQDTSELTARTTLSLGVRLHRVTYDVSDDVNVTEDSRDRDLRAFEVALRQRLGESLSLYGKFGNSFRVPNVNDNYNLFTATITMLEPQTSHDRELGIEYQTAATHYRAALYEMDINHEIHLDPIAFNNVNLPPTRRYGLELEGKWSFTDAISAFANYTYAVAKFREGAFGGIDVSDKDVPLVPRSSANVGATWQSAPGARLDAVVRYVGEQIYDGDETNTFGRKMPAYTVADLKLSKQIAGWLLSAGVENIFDEKYFSYGVYTGFPTFSAYPEPGRSWFASVQYTLK